MQNLLKDKNECIVIGSRLRNQRKQKGMLQKAVANALEMKNYTLQSIESGTRKATYSELLTLCNFYKVTTDEILKGTNDNNVDFIFLNSFNSLDDKNKKDVLNYITYKQYCEETLQFK